VSQPDDAPPRVTLAQAVALGLLHGPAELLPVSSSGHTILAAWFCGWRHEEIDAAARKRFEVALHAGALAAALAVARREGGSPAAVIALACVPAALAGALGQSPIERRLGTPGGVAAGLLAGSAAMVVSESRSGGRRRGEAHAVDALALGVAQALALAPGVSRSGAARAAARLRGFAPREAEALSQAAGLPVTVGALALKARELRDGERSEWPALAAGAAAALASGAATGAVLRRRGQKGGSLLPYAAYRTAVAAAVVRRLLRHNGRR
jgi:undecaprenyl-diphosphatase